MEINFLFFQFHKISSSIEMNKGNFEIGNWKGKTLIL